jgi:hypothetical protein
MLNVNKNYLLNLTRNKIKIYIKYTYKDNYSIITQIKH